MIVDPYIHATVLPGIDLGDPSKFTTEIFQGECTESEIQRLVDVGKGNNVDCVIGLGGGEDPGHGQGRLCSSESPYRNSCHVCLD